MFRVHHHGDLVVATVGLVVGLVVVAEAFDHQLLGVAVSTDLVLVGPLVVADHLVDLRNYLAAVVVS